jgi:AcrR family transcriptional regulator
MTVMTVLAWRERQTAHTREHIIDVAKALLVQAPTEPFSHEKVAQVAGLGARTVYRHFPSRADLMQALWERVRADSKTRFPSNEEEIVAFARTQFNEFNEREGLVRASLSFSASTELRARGSLEGRPAFRRSLAHITKHLPVSEQRRLIAVCLAIYSAPFWQLLRDRGELTGDEPGEAAAWALTVVLQAAKARTSPTRTRKAPKKENEHGHRSRRREER